MDTDVAIEETCAKHLEKSLLKECLVQLKTYTDELFGLIRDPTQTDTIPFFRQYLIPILLKLRHHNREEKAELDKRGRKVKEIYSELSSLDESCASLEFEVACLATEVNLDIKDVKRYGPSIESPTTNGIIADNRFDVNIVSKKDHQTRMRMLEEEKQLRLELQHKLTKLHDEINNIEDTSIKSAQNMDYMKPHIQELLREFKSMKYIQS